MSDLLKQAIADAKAVRATALANAKAALEEAFAPKLQSMLATQLQQEVDDEGSEDLAEPAAPAPMDAAPIAQDVPVDEPAPMDIAPEAPVAPAEEVPMDAAPIGGEEELPLPGAEAAPAPEEAPIDEFDTTANPMHNNDSIAVSEGEKASSDYKKETSGHKTEDPGKNMVKKAVSLSTPAAKGATSSSSKASSNYKTMPKGNEIKNIKASGTEDPQGASNELSKGPGKADTTGTKALEENDISDESLDEILKELEAEVNQGSAPVAPVAPMAESEDEEINLAELFGKDEDKDDVDEGKLPPWLKKKGEKSEDGDKDDDDKDDDKDDAKNENISLKKELQEYRSAVQYLRNQINEVNLLNAKLLYTNKLFKQASLTNEQKLKVIEQFDLTKTVREAKLTYANLSESFNFGGKNTPVPAPSTKKAAVVKTITEGLASKSVGSTKPSAQVLSEGTDMANRFKKLAGIRSK